MYSSAEVKHVGNGTLVQSMNNQRQPPPTATIPILTGQFPWPGGHGQLSRSFYSYLQRIPSLQPPALSIQQTSR